MDSQDQNNSMNNASKKKSSKREKNFRGDINHGITSFKAILNHEYCFEDDNNERYLNNLSIGDLNTKVNQYNSWYLEDKINVDNAFDIDLISCVQQMVKRSKKTDILAISNTFDAISKVYSCRVDGILKTGNKLIKEFVAETKNKKPVKEKENETNTKQKSRKKLMLTTAEKLRSKDKEMLPRKHFFNVDFDNDLIDYAKPSRILMNRYSNDTYWPEYNVSKNVPKVNENQQETYYEMENLSLLMKNGKICPAFHKFIAECDKSTNCDDDSDVIKLDNIQTHFSQETSAFCANNSNETDDSMDEDFNKPSSEIIVHTSPGPSNQNSNQFDKPENLDSLSQTLSLLDTIDISDYTFFDRQKIRNFKCPDHWKEKVEMMKTDSKQKAMLIKSRVAQTHSETNVNLNCRNSRDIQFKVDFYLDKTTILKNMESNFGKNLCSYNKWGRNNNIIPSSDQRNPRPIRQLENCKYINMVPNWYKHEFEELNLNTNPNTLFLFPEQDILKDRLLLDEVPVENTDYIDKNVMDTDHYSESGNEDDGMMTEINHDNNFTIALNQQNTTDDDYEEEYSPTCNSGYIDMQELKKYIMDVIKPDGVKTNILFSYVIEQLPKFLSENMKKNINVSVIYVALLHLCNEHSLCLQDINDDILITQGSVDLNN